jgi:hypothetical protein
MDVHLTDLKRALYDDGDAFRVVLIRAKGGSGKTRLLEEMMAKVNHPNHEWHKEDDNEDDNEDDKPWPEAEAENATIVTDLIDVIDARLHDRNRFINAAYESLQGYRHQGVEFKQYLVKWDELRARTATGAQLEDMRKTQDEAAKAFVDDLREITKQRRVAIVVDTAERLSYDLLDQLLDKDVALLRDTDLKSRTHVWLQQLIRNDGLPTDPDKPSVEGTLGNMTLILAGRDEEGASFFKRITDAVSPGRIDADKVDATPAPDDPETTTLRIIELIDIELRNLDEDDTRQLFENLEEDWRKKEKNELDPDYRARAKRIADHYQLIHTDKYQELHKYTSGLPVSLMLYAQIVADSKIFPDLLQLKYDQALEKAPKKAKHQNVDDRAKWVQWQIEDKFIDLIFDNRPAALHSRILRALLRAPRGLTAEQLEFVLYADPNEKPDEWIPNPKRVVAILEDLKQIEQSYLGKRRSSWDEFGWLLADSEVPEAATYRIGLQDEIYRIFAQHRAPFSQPFGKDEGAATFRRLAGKDERQKYIDRHRDEVAARAAQYEKLRQWADRHYERLLEVKRHNLAEDERRFERELQLHNPKTYSFTDLVRREISERSALNLALAALEIERMAYELLLDPARSLNTSYITLEDDNDKAAREEEDFWAQAEMWRTINDDHLMKFVDVKQSPAAKKRGEPGIAVVRRVAEQENIARWIKRFALRDRYVRAIEFADRVEEMIQNPDQLRRLTLSPRQGEPEQAFAAIQNSWLHTVAVIERRIWRNVAAIRQATNVVEPRREIEDSLVSLRWYVDHTVNQRRKVNDRWEYGFRADPDTKTEQHPALVRLLRLLSHGHNTIGYGYRTTGRMSKAVQNYSRALYYIWDQKELMLPHRAVLLNNLARALSEMGEVSIEVCLDGMDLRRKLAEEVPYASSLNTMALIYDDLGRYEDAPPLSAKAIAYCRRAGESRQLGLALRQMAESLRHLGERIHTGQRSALDVEYFFGAAELLLLEARGKFSGSAYQRERLIEVEIELGSLYRDRLESRLTEIKTEAQATPDRYFDDYRTEALEQLESAVQRANEEGGDPLIQHQIDGYVNLARVHYLVHEYYRLLAEKDGERADRLRQSDKALVEVNDRLATIRRLPVVKPYLITKRRVPNPHDLKDQNWVFRQLSTVERIKGWQASSEFQERIKKLTDKYGKEYRDYLSHSGNRDARETRAALKRMAEAFGLSMYYAELYSPRSRSAITAENEVYRRIKKFNETEAHIFVEDLRQLHQEYGERVPTFNRLEAKLEQWLGYSEPPKQVGNRPPGSVMSSDFR